VEEIGREGGRKREGTSKGWLTPAMFEILKNTLVLVTQSSYCRQSLTEMNHWNELQNCGVYVLQKPSVEWSLRNIDVDKRLWACQNQATKIGLSQVPTLNP